MNAAQYTPVLVDGTDEFDMWAEDVGNRRNFSEEDMTFPTFSAEEEERLVVLTEETGSMDLMCAPLGSDVWPVWAGPTWDVVCGDVRSARLVWAFDCSMSDAEALYGKDHCINRALAESPRVFMAWVTGDVLAPEFSGMVGGIREDWRELVIARCGRFASWPEFG